MDIIPPIKNNKITEIYIFSKEIESLIVTKNITKREDNPIITELNYNCYRGIKFDKHLESLDCVLDNIKNINSY